MKLKRFGALVLATLAAIPTLMFTAGCSNDKTVTLRIFNWEEYIDEGGEDSWDGTEDAPAMIQRFETWYEETYGTPSAWNIPPSAPTRTCTTSSSSATNTTSSAPRNT